MTASALALAPRLQTRPAVGLFEHCDAFEPPPDRTASEWATGSQLLESSEGIYRPERTPWVRVLDRFVANPWYKRVVFICGSQMTKTTFVQHTMGQRLDDDPCPMVALFPTRDAAEDLFEPRLRYMLWNRPTLRRKTVWGKGQKKTKKTIAGCTVRLAWAGSPVQLAMQPAGLAFVDERDRMRPVRREGDPLRLIEARGKTFPGFTVIVTTTPLLGTVDVEEDPETQLARFKVGDPLDIDSPGWKLWQEGTRHEWAWPCPHCETYFVPRFRALKWEGETPEEAQDSAHLVCARCQGEIRDTVKTELNALAAPIAPGEHVTLRKGVPVITGEPPRTRTASLWASGLVSPWQSFGDLAHDYVSSVRTGDPNEVQSVVNTGFGELWSVQGDAPDWEEVAACRDAYLQGEMPEGLRAVTFGADVQLDRIYWVAVGWGRRLEPWVLRHGEVFGETTHDQVWREADVLPTMQFGTHTVALGAIDSGWRPRRRDFDPPTNMIYQWARRHGNVRVTKGQQTLDGTHRTASIDVTVSGRRIKGGLKLSHLNTDFFKRMIHDRVKWPAEQPGRLHLPADATDEFCQHIVAEARIPKASGGFVWFQRRRANHYLDALVGAFGAAYILNLHVVREMPTPPPRGSAPPPSPSRPGMPSRGRGVRGRFQV